MKKTVLIRISEYALKKIQHLAIDQKIGQVEALDLLLAYSPSSTTPPIPNGKPDKPKTKDKRGASHKARAMRPQYFALKPKKAKK